MYFIAVSAVANALNTSPNYFSELLSPFDLVTPRKGPWWHPLWPRFAWGVLIRHATCMTVAVCTHATKTRIKKIRRALPPRSLSVFMHTTLSCDRSIAPSLSRGAWSISLWMSELSYMAYSIRDLIIVRTCIRYVYRISGMTPSPYTLYRRHLVKKTFLSWHPSILRCTIKYSYSYKGLYSNWEKICQGSAKMIICSITEPISPLL